MATNGVPILLLSATCQPIAIQSILCSLKLKEDNIKIICGELIWKEITIVCTQMASSLASCDDLLNIYGPVWSIFLCFKGKIQKF